MKKTFLALSLVAISASFSQATLITVTGVFADPNIPDGVGNLTNQVTVTGLTGPISGSNVTIRLIGLQHEAAGDLVVIIRHVASGVMETVFSRVGSANPAVDFGSASQLATIVGPYEFNAAGPQDLWATAAGLGAVDTIPDSSLFLPFVLPYRPSQPLTGTPHGFASLATISDPNGVWEIVISDGAVDFTGSILGWELEIFQAEVPEPGTVGLVVGAMAMLWLGRRRRGRR